MRDFLAEFQIARCSSCMAHTQQGSLQVSVLVVELVDVELGKGHGIMD